MWSSFMCKCLYNTFVHTYFKYCGTYSIILCHTLPYNGMYIIAKITENLLCVRNFLNVLCIQRTSPVAQIVKNLPTMQKTWVWFLGWEDPLEKRMATHISFLAWRIPWTEESGRLQSMGLQRVGHDWATNTFTVHVFNILIPQ